MRLQMHLANNDKQHSRVHFSWHTNELKNKPLKPNAAAAIKDLSTLDRVSAKLFILYLTACAIEGIHPLDDAPTTEPKIIVPGS